MKKTKKIQIKDLEIGMKIKTKGRDGSIVFKTVTDKWNTVVRPQDQTRLLFENGVVLNCSINHPVMCQSDLGAFEQKLPRDLTTGERVLTESGVTRLSEVQFAQHNDENYIDITVEDVHTFFASGSSEGPMVLTHNSQGGIRNASATVFYPIWHYQFDDLIVLKNNQGTEETRVRHMDYGVVLSAFFWRRFKNQENITFFDPNEVPDLYEAFYKNTALFEELYVKYEKRKDLRKKIMSAEEVFKGGILKERTDTGRIYLVFIDNVMNQGPFDPEYHTIYQSNLCCVTGNTQVVFQHENGNLEQMSVSSAVERFELGGLTTSKIKSFKNGKVSWQNVFAAIKTKTVTELYEIEDSDGNLLRCTADHLIYTKNRGYVRADQLAETDELCVDLCAAKNSNMIEIRKIKVEPTDVYDISVPETKCFFADNILVHNCEILLPTTPFMSLDDEGEFKLELDNGKQVTLPGQHKVLLVTGEKKKVRELNEDDDIKDLLI